jgi:hypothetical protein
LIPINPQYLPLAKLVNDRLFRIPGYQRAYSWTSKERNDLFSDIVKTHLKGPDAGHFMAATVCLRRLKITLGTNEFQELEVVDGQQRLTTLIILLKTITLALNPDDKSESKLANELSDLLVKAETDDLLLLQTNHDSSHHYVTFMRKGIAPPSIEATTLANRELLHAIEECSNFVAGWKENIGAIPTLASLLKNRLYFLLHEIDDEKSVYTVFEVLNSRGLDVSWMDRLKSILMGAAFELEKGASPAVVKELYTTWQAIYAAIGLRQGMSTEALRFAATLWTDKVANRPFGEKDAVDILRDGSRDAKRIREVAHWLLKTTEACNTVTADPRINAVTRISQARLLAVALYLRDDIKPAQRTPLLARWEKISFRIYGMLGNDARKRVGDYVRLAWQIVNEKLSPKDIDAQLSEIGKEFPIEQAVSALRNTNCYVGWESELRYFMFRYEEHLAREKGLNFRNEQWAKIWMESPSDSIEHIFPESKAPDKLKHRLGNLVLLPPRLNSKLQDNKPKDKVEAYRQTGLLIASQVADAIDAGGWDKDAIQQREDKLLEWAMKEWAD